MRLSASLVGSALLLASCGPTKAPLPTIPVDVDKAGLISIDTSRLVELETSDSSMIYDVSSFELCGDRFIVHSRNYLRSFDIRTGRFTGNVARSGKNYDEFSYIGNLWLEGDTIVFFDTNNGAIFSYATDGTFYGRTYPFGMSFSPEEKPRQYYTIPEVGVFSTNLSNDHTAPRNPRYSFYHFGDTVPHPVDGREICEPTFLSDGTFEDVANKRLLSWEPLRDTVFAVTREGVAPLYHVDFGELALPAEVQAMPYSADRIKYFNRKSTHRYASLIRYLQTKNDNIYFAFACSDEKNYLVCYNIPTQSTTVRHVASPDEGFSQTTFFKITGDSAFVEVRDRNNLLSNPYFYQIALADLQ